MADIRITDLTEIPIVSGADVMPIVDVSEDSGQGVTRKIPISSILPSDGDEGQVLKKVSSSEYDTEWANLDKPQFAVLSYRLSGDLDPPNIPANTNWVIPYAVYTSQSNDASDRNDIPNLAVPEAGTITIPPGLYSIYVACQCKRNVGSNTWTDAELLILKEDVLLLSAGKATFYYWTEEKPIVAKRILNVVTGGNFKFCLRGTSNMQAGINVYVSTADPLIKERMFGQLVIERISDAIA